MVHESRADDGVGADLKRTSLGLTTGTGAWIVCDDGEVGEEEGVHVNRSRLIPAERGRPFVAMGL